MTVPNMSLTLKQLILNHTRGISSDIINREGEYFDTEIPRFDDITEMVEHKEDLLIQKKELEEKIHKELNEKEALRKQKAEKAAKAIEAKKVPETALKNATANEQEASKKP